ncbi:MAG: phosphoenolpyruvate carboxykinase domain-containing protein [Planctomycetota bacterium]|nr:phosphoenolpyruvate carboxykinase domain-containing protein [Planctomycetota bacterium]
MTSPSTPFSPVESAIDSLPAHVQEWVRNEVALCKPEAIEIITGDVDQIIQLENELEAAGAYTRLDEQVYGKRSFYARSDKNDVARVEERTVICTDDPIDAGPLNFWKEPAEMHCKLDQLFDGSMKGRTMYVVPFVTNPADSQFASAGVQLTDSANVVCNLYRMSNLQDGWRILKKQSRFPRITHSYGTLSKEDRWITHFPKELYCRTINSDYGGNALGPKKIFGLRLVGIQALENARKKSHPDEEVGIEFVEHMALFGIDYGDRRVHFGAAFPSMCGKTNIANGVSEGPMADNKVFTLGDDIIGGATKKGDGRLFVNNIESGIFGVTRGMSDFANKMLMEALRHPKPEVQDCEGGPIFTNQVLVDHKGSKRVWWSDSGTEFPVGEGITTWNWLGEQIGTDGKEKDQKNARVTMPIRNVPHLEADYHNAEGVPLDVCLIGGRSSKLHPLISRARTWNEAVYHALCQFSEPTAAAVGQKPRYDPMANRPFIAFNVSDYAQKWLSLPQNTPRPPVVFSVNWFRRNDAGQFVWDGFGANYRVLDAAVRELAGEDRWVETPMGLVPQPEHIDISGLKSTTTIEQLAEILVPDKEALKNEVDNREDWLHQIENGLEAESEGRGAPKKLPQAIWAEHETFKKRVKKYCE